MIRIEVEVETNDPGLRDYVLGDVESWRRTPAKVSVSTREEDAWTGGAKTLRVSTSASMSLGSVADDFVEEEQPPAERRIAPPQLTSLEAARGMVAFSVFAVPALAVESTPTVMVELGGDDLPASVVVTHG